MAAAESRVRIDAGGTGGSIVAAEIRIQDPEGEGKRDGGVGRCREKREMQGECSDAALTMNQISITQDPE